MLIHSVTPAQFLTDPWPESAAVSGVAAPQTEYKAIPFGYVEGISTPEGFRMNRLLSTDPSQYLDVNFTPGGICRL
ncbi:YlzJ-like family protein [Oscillospiraceae bacterium MB08-C2-2]|nr:YlzJ-like family protein [Oscillospiraceae bacterium MB08-C2-2]